MKVANDSAMDLDDDDLCGEWFAQGEQMATAESDVEVPLESSDGSNGGAVRFGWGVPRKLLRRLAS
jgi:hypothetical protein